METAPSIARHRPKPALEAQCCKGCGRCIEACAHHCIEAGTEIHPLSGLIPIRLHLEDCTACGLCLTACPEPYGLVPLTEAVSSESARSAQRVSASGEAASPLAVAEPIPDERLPLPESRPLIVKGTYASAIGALLGGCRHFFGYPITPSTEGAELMARLLPKLGGTFVQAVSEVAAVNMIYGCGAAGLPALTFTSSPGFSLMLEGISYMIGAEVPGVIVNVMRGGPGLGNIAPEQADIKLVCRGLGHGHTHAIVLAPATPQEMLDLTMVAFHLAFAYRNPVIVVADGYLGQMTGKVRLPRSMVRPGRPSWAVFGDGPHRANLVSSIYLSEVDLEAHNRALSRKYALIAEREERADLYRCDDAEVLLLACNTPARMAKGAVEILRQQGVRAGLFRPVTLWPFPIRRLLPLVSRIQRVIVVEASEGQLEDELRLALSHAEIGGLAIEGLRHGGGVLPQTDEIVERVKARPAASRGNWEAHA